MYPQSKQDRLLAVPLDENIISQLSTVPFDCGDTDLNAFLREDAHMLQQQGLTFGYVAIRGGLVVGYIALSCDAIALDGDEKRTIKIEKSRIPRTVPCLKVGRLAASKDLQRGNGIGKFLMGIAFDKALQLSSVVGCRFLSVDAYPDAESFYIRLGFVHNQKINRQKTAYRKSMKSKNSSDKDDHRPNVSMRLDIFAPELPDWLLSRNVDHQAP